MPTLTITPDMFVSAPYTECPNCHGTKYGILMINRDNYCRRCNDCMHTENYSLPRLEKKVIYLDQMVISNMMNSLRPSTRTCQRLDPKWKQLYEKIDRLVKLQLIVCPHSNIHEEESIVTPVYRELEKMYERLSNGVSFYSIKTIVRFQIHEAFMKWLDREFPTIDKYQITHGDIDAWEDKVRVSVRINRNTDYVESILDIRNRQSDNFTQVFNRWRTETDKNYMDWYNEERNAYGPAYFQEYINSILSNDLESTIIFALSEISVTIVSLKSVLQRDGLSEKEAFLRLQEFFNSESFKDIPFLKIYSMLCAVIADQAAHQGRANPPNQGTSNDLSFISAFTPYCDALFVDNAFKDHILQGDHQIRLGISNKFFSYNTIDQFIEYLDGIENFATEDHLEIIEEIYGNSE